jgi:NCS1 family nucleobase:cation symporter-1
MGAPPDAPAPSPAIAPTQTLSAGLLDLAPEAVAELQGSPLLNEDLRPVPVEGRTWTWFHIACLWIGMSVCVPTYQLASGLIAQGMNWWQACLTVFLGNAIVLVPMSLIAFAGTRYGIPYPIFCRASFGTFGAHLPALLRAGVACGWFGIQAWIGGEFLHVMVHAIVPAWPDTFAGRFACFLVFWAINVWIGYRGTESIKWMETWGGPILIGMGVALVVWALSVAGWSFDTLLSATSRLAGKAQERKDFWVLFLPSLNGMISFWATLALNIPDFTRYARSQRDQVLGQVLGLPTTMGFYAFVGVAGTLGSILVFNEAIWDPAALMKRFGSTWLSILGGFGIFLATITTNIAANVVAPANAFSNLSPRTISYRAGVIVTGILGILICPWKLLSDPDQYIFVWLGTYGSFLGPLAGLYLADYYYVRGQRLDLADLYRPAGGRYDYAPHTRVLVEVGDRRLSMEGGVNARAVQAYALAVVPFLADRIFGLAGGLVVANSWVVGLLTGFLAYALLMRDSTRSLLSEAEFDAITRKA